MLINQRKILLVEDNPDDEALTLRAFGKNRIANEIVVARDGVEALEWIFAEGRYASRDPSELPAVILLDIKLPKVDGIDVLRRIKSDPKTSPLPVVMLTSSGEQEDLLRSYQLGANSYIRKPVVFEQFVQTVGHLGVYWLLVNEPPPLPPPRRV